MANRPKNSRAGQSNSPNFKMIEPAEGGIHSAVGTGVAQQQAGSQVRQGAVGKNEHPNTQEQTNQD